MPWREPLFFLSAHLKGRFARLFFSVHTRARDGVGGQFEVLHGCLPKPQACGGARGVLLDPLVASLLMDRVIADGWKLWAGSMLRFHAGGTTTEESIMNCS